MYYRIGEGHKEYIPDKTVDEEFRLLTIAAICDECRNCGFYEGNIYLAVGCPTAMLTAQRESTREYFMKIPILTASTITFITTSTLSDASFIRRDMRQLRSIFTI